MKLNKNAQVAIAVGWFALIDILLSTTGGAVGAVSGTSSTFRGIIRGFGLNYFILGLGIVALVSIGLLALLIIAYVVRAWTSVIKLTRVLVKYFFFTSDSVDSNEEEKKMLQSLFGGDTLVSKDALFWLSLRSLLAIWIVIIIINIIASIINVLSAY